MKNNKLLVIFLSVLLVSLTGCYVSNADDMKSELDRCESNFKDKCSFVAVPNNKAEKMGELYKSWKKAN